MHHNGYPFVKNFPGVTCQNTSKCIKMDVNFKKKVREWLVKMAQNAPKWISVFQKFSRDEVRKYFKMHQNGCKCKKKFQG